MGFGYGPFGSDMVLSIGSHKEITEKPMNDSPNAFQERKSGWGDIRP